MSKINYTIGISGKARSGKDTFAKMLADSFFNIINKRFVLISFADELKNRLQKDFDLSYEQLWGDEKEVQDKRFPKKDGGFWTAREMMQFFGTECMRSMDEHFWVKALFRTIDDKEFNNVIIPDVRFKDEADEIVRRDGYIIKIDREGSRDSITNECHSSENSMDDYESIDLTIRNCSDLKDLKREADQVAKWITTLEIIKDSNNNNRNNKLFRGK